MNGRVASDNLVELVTELVKSGKLDDAKKRLKKKLKATPDDAWAHFALGSALLIGNDLIPAEKHLKSATRINPNYVDAYNHLGVLYARAGAPFDTVLNQFNQALELDPNHFDTLLNLGQFRLRNNQVELAEEVLAKALQIQPDNADAINNMGVVKVKQNRRSEALPLYRRALELSPHDHIRRSNYLSCLRTLKKHDELIDELIKVSARTDIGMEAFPAFSAMRLYAMWGESKKMLDLVLHQIDHDSNALQNFSFLEINMVALAMPEIDNALLFRLHKLAGQIAVQGRQGKPFDYHPNAMKPAKRWRIGYLSPDFRAHVVSTFLRGMINERNKNHFEIYCYSNTKYPDHITEEYRAAADFFIDVTGLSDRELANRIHADGIHFLVDLTGYTQDARTDVMCYRPAPVQMMYMGYPYTSGIPQVDYFVSDAYLDGPDNAQYFTEKHIHLPEVFTAFGELHEQVIADQPPCRKHGFITFGSLNSTYKLNEQVIELWSRVLSMVSNSRMVINHPYCEPEAVRKNISREFERNGIGQERIEFIWQKHPDGNHLRYYNDIDIALDTFPLTGGTTTIDAIWMGVPVITLVGALYHQRLSYTILKNAGIDLDDLIAFDKDEFVTKAVALANNPDRIAHYRHAIPAGLRGAVLCDPVRLTRHIEKVYLEAWDKKYPQRPVNMEITDDAVEWHRIQEQFSIATPRDLNDFANYVLQEQSGWYEPEWYFVQTLAKPGMRILDIGAEYGQYAIPMAQKAGNSSKLWAVARLPHEAELLAKSLARNDLQQAEILIGGDRKLRLDVEMVGHALYNLDFVHIQVDFAKKKLFEEGAEFFTQNSPLAMFSINKVDEKYNLDLVGEFEKLGYRIFRLIPGLNCLVPFNGETDLDVFALNLFAAKQDCADRLRQQGLLIEQTQGVAELPGIHVTEWQAYLKGKPYASNSLADWVGLANKPADWEVYWVALNLFALAQNPSAGAGYRYACLQSALGILSMLAQSQPRLPRLVTLMRVLVDLGKREQAVHLLNQVCTAIDPAADIILDEPFLPISEDIAGSARIEGLGRKVFANMLQQREKLRAFSGYFTGREALPALEEMQKLGLGNEEMSRRAALIHARYG